MPKTTAKPLLTIAIPTFNRAHYLQELLSSLFEQVIHEPNVELIVSDNASADDTTAIVREYQDRGLDIRYVRNDTNLGADANVLQCFEQAQGKYVWIIGDDDIVVPGGLARILHYLEVEDHDLVFVSAYPFLHDWYLEHRYDRFARGARIITNRRLFAKSVGINATFISSIIANKARISALPHAVYEELVGTSLVHLGWILPLMIHLRSGLYIYEQLVAGRSGNSGGYNICAVFSRNLKIVTDRILTGHPELSNAIVNDTLRNWFPNTALRIRTGEVGNFEREDIHQILKPIFGGNYRYWAFVFPVIRGPLWFAKTCVVGFSLLADVERIARNLLINRSRVLASRSAILL